MNNKISPLRGYFIIVFVALSALLIMSIVFSPDQLIDSPHLNQFPNMEKATSTFQLDF